MDNSLWKIRAKTTLSILVLTTLFSFMVRSQSPNPIRDNVVVSTKDHIVSYSVDGDKVVFVMEAISDFTDEMNGTFPQIDFMRLDVDFNQNGIIDKNVDLGFATHTGGLCSVFLISSSSSSTCGGFESKGNVDLSFQGTKNEARKHPIYKYTIPRGELTSGRDCIDVVFTFYSSGRGYTYFPFRAIKSTHSLAKTLRIKL